MMSQANITAETPMGANLVDSGATFRCWAPRAPAVYVNGTFGGVAMTGETDDLLMMRDDRGYWTGFMDAASDGDPYHFYVVGAGSQGYKRDPYAREMARDSTFPTCSCVIRSATAYPWHDAGFVTPDYSDMIVYQLHVGTYAPASPGAVSTFLDVIRKIEYLAALGINVLQPLPIDELETQPSQGYNGADYFSPDTPYIVTDPNALAGYLAMINRMLAAKGQAPLTLADISTAPAQLKAMIDLCHLYGIAVVLDVVYNHAGGFEGDDQSLYFWDRATNGDNNQSLYFTNMGWAGGLAFALWNQDVSEFVINSAGFYLDEFHVDGFRYDEISALLQLGGSSGWEFCCNITDTVRYLHPRAIQNAEHWPVDGSIVTPVANGGAGFDVTQHDGLRLAVRAAIAQASGGANASIDLDSVAANLFPCNVAEAWQAVPCVENHDVVYLGRDQRIPMLADSGDPLSWYARSRSRVALALLMTAPGIPQIFMGQEFLESRQWSDDPTASSNLISWPGSSAAEKPKNDFLRFTQDLIRLRWNHPALRGDAIDVFHVHDQNRVIAFQRWIPGAGLDVVVVATLRESTWSSYDVGFPSDGQWLEVFNSDIYDNFPNPDATGNGGAITASGGPMHGLPASASIVIPANGVVIFARSQSY